ncbi:MAG TPA: cation-translocating P-type ATPase, partial [Clostridia bacterium]|nr:cation-translocating P-type ATPase [Clostridia bacterium]
QQMSSQGLRVIAVCFAVFEDKDNIPAQITDCRLRFAGLVGLADPPRGSIREDIKECIRAGIRVVMITGDNGITASAIASEIGMENCGKVITGDEIDSLSDEELSKKIKDVSIFARVVPEHKMRIVKAFKESGEVVAMTGDGVNDAPALKYADIGIAMGKRGSEVSREAAGLILMDDNFSTIVDTIKDGRRIFDNIRKAVGYVFTIHAPIALASLLAPLLKINPGFLMLLPFHVVLLELVIDPTCSVVLERQPAEKNIMSRPPQKPNEKILNAAILVKSVIQGLVIFAVSFGTYYYLLKTSGNAETARTMGLVIILISNLLLVLENSSNIDSAFVSAKLLVRDKVFWAVNIGTVLLLLVMLYTPLSQFLSLAALKPGELLACAGLAFISVMWYEAVKIIRRKRFSRQSI